mgnify:CR=1 FL=1|tara:strand:+ start:7047 stop:8705 length:1659 start_codon:yes stop_codon:yes gene_type:complete
MGELEKLIDNLIRDVKNPKMKKDLIRRLKAAQSKEQPLEDLTDGKLEEIEKLKKKLDKVAKLNKSLVKISKERRWNRSTGSPLSGGSSGSEDPRLLNTGAGTGWKGFTEKPKVREAVPKGTEKKPAETFAVSNKQPYGGKAPLSRTVSTGVKTDEPTTGGVKDSAAPITNTSSKQNKKENKKESKSRKFLNRLLGREEKKDKPLTSSTSPTPTSTETSRTQSGAIPKPDDNTSQTATASTSQIKEEKPKKKKKEVSIGDALKKLKREHEASKKKREALTSGKKVEKPKGKKGKKTVSTEEFTSDFSRGSPKMDEVSDREVDTSKFVNELANKPSVQSGFNRRNRRRKKKSLIKAMEEFLEKDALTNRWTETIMGKPSHNAMVDSQRFTRQQTGARYDQRNDNKRSAPNSKWDKLGDVGEIKYQEIMDNEGNPTGKYAKNHHGGGQRKNPLAHGNKERQRNAASKIPVPTAGSAPKDLKLKKALDMLYRLEKDGSGYGDLNVANVYPMESYNEPSLIGKPVGEIQSPSNISETYIVSRESKGKENDHEQDNKN